MTSVEVHDASGNTVVVNRGYNWFKGDPNRGYKLWEYEIEVGVDDDMTMR